MFKKNIRLLSTGFISREIIEEHIDPMLSVDIVPFTSIQPLTDPSTQKIIAAIAEKNTYVIFTSVNALRAATASLVKIPEWKIFCTNGPTLRETIAFFGKDSVTASAENAQQLAELIVTEKITAAVFFCGTQRLDTLPDLLAKADIAVVECVVYESNAARNALDKTYDGILFYSPLSVKTFFIDNDLARDTVVFALGSTTASALRNYTSTEIRMAPAPEKSALLRLAIDYFTFQTIQGS